MLALLVAAILPLTEVRAVRVTTVEDRPALQVETSAPVSVAVDVREGPLILLRIPARALDGLATPSPEPPIEQVRLTAEGERTMVSLLLAPGTRFETRHEPTRTTVVFGDPAAATATPITPELYARLFEAAASPSPEPPPTEEGREGIQLGPFAVRPALTAAWVDADVSFTSPQPVRNRYLQVQPGLTLSTSLRAGQLVLSYEPRFRFFATNPALDSTSHFASANLTLPLGRRLATRLSHSYTHALLEASVVDPGREYFFDLAPFTSQDTTAAVDFELSPRLYLLASAGLGRNSFEEAVDAGFFDYDQQMLGLGLGYDLAADLRLALNWGRDRVPAPADRPIAATSGQFLTVSLAGDLGPLTSGSLSVGGRRQDSPQAAGRSSSWSGLVASGALRREFGRSTSLELGVNRETLLSKFEANAYYVTNSATLALTAPLPLRIAARGSVLILQNDYPETADAIGEPRQDRLLGWTAGLGRELGRRIWLRADYRRERRESNLPGFDITTTGFTIQATMRLGPTSVAP